MDRKEFFKHTCGLGLGSCLGLSLLMNDNAVAAEDQKSNEEKNTSLVPADTRQIQNVLSYIESSMDESVTKSIFELLLDLPLTKVVIDESYLLGGKRCSSTLYIEGKLQLG